MRWTPAWKYSKLHLDEKWRGDLSKSTYAVCSVAERDGENIDRLWSVVDLLIEISSEFGYVSSLFQDMWGAEY